MGLQPLPHERQPVVWAHGWPSSSVTKLVASGFRFMRTPYLTFQEYFERLGTSRSAGASRWPLCWAHWTRRLASASPPSAVRTACPAPSSSWMCLPRWCPSRNRHRQGRPRRSTEFPRSLRAPSSSSGPSRPVTGCPNSFSLKANYKKVGADDGRWHGGAASSVGYGGPLRLSSRWVWATASASR